MIGGWRSRRRVLMLATMGVKRFGQPDRNRNFPVIKMIKVPWIAAAFTAILLTSIIESAVAAEEKTSPARSFLIPKETDALLDNYCYDCHDGETQKGDIRLNHLAGLENSKRLDLLNRMQEQLYFQHMPPKKGQRPKKKKS